MSEIKNVDEMNPAEENVEFKEEKKSDGVVTAKKKRRGISYEKKQGLVGFLFILPWLIGFIMFFLVPMIKSIIFSFSKVNIFEDYATEWNNFDNFVNIFTRNAKFIPNLTSTISQLFINVPIILVFSLFVAVLLNREFIGRGIARAVFFLPVIVTTGVVMTAFNGASDTTQVFSGNVSGGILFSTMNATELISNLGLSPQIAGYLMQIADRIFDVVWNSGIQIILFLAALQGISPALYEACDVEGATAWEKFWLITFPNVSPIILVNIVYTIVDTFSDPSNPILSQVDSLVNGTFDFGTAAAMTWIYFIIVLAIIGLVFLVCKKLIFYSVD